MEVISSNKKIAKNTIYLYLRMMFMMAVTLYTSRVNLQALGINDTGIYQIIGGVVAAFGFLNSSLSGATSRFLTFELGKGDQPSLNRTFATALNIHIGLAVVIFIIAETIGLWFLENKLVIPEERMNAARIVYQLSIFSCMFSITQVPYGASLISHEKMGVFAYFAVLDALLKLLICYLLFVTPFDRLVTYAILVFVVTVFMQMIYRLYCMRHFEECHFKLIKDKSILRPMLSFSLWDLFGNFGVMMRNEGVNIVLNLFFGPAINAACGFSNNIQSAIRGFSDNFMIAVRPPVVKSYSINDIRKMESLMINASKFSFCLMILLSTPFFFESTFIINLWLKTPPAYTDAFCVVALSINVVRVMFSPLMFGIHATGKIKYMSIVNGSMLFLIVPISYVLLRMGASPIVPFVVDFFMMLLLAVSQLYFTKKNIPEFSIPRYLKQSTVPCLIIGVTVILLTFFVKELLGEDSFVRLFEICMVSTLLTGLMTYMVALNKENRQNVLLLIKNKIHRKV